MSLEGKCCCEKYISEYVRGFHVYNSCFGYFSATSLSFDFALGPHSKWPVMSGDASAGKRPRRLQVVGALCCLGTLHSVLLGVGRGKHLNFSQKSPKILKMASECFIHALLLFLGLFLKISL